MLGTYELWILICLLQGFYSSPPAEGREEVFIRPLEGRGGLGSRKSTENKGATTIMPERSGRQPAGETLLAWGTRMSSGCQLPKLLISISGQGPCPSYSSLFPPPRRTPGMPWGLQNYLLNEWMSQPINQLRESSFIQLHYESGVVLDDCLVSLLNDLFLYSSLRAV